MNHKIPEAKEGFIRTLNRMGFMTMGLDPYSQAFVDFSAVSSLPVLDIGAAYGVASIAALKRGAKVIANDLDARHLRLLKHNAPAQYQSFLALQPGRFPDALDFPVESLGAVLASRILHFLEGENIRAGLRKIHTWLVSGGKCFIVAETVYVRTMQAMIPLYEARVKKHEEWPGYFDNVKKYAAEEVRDKLPDHMHFMDEKILRRECEQAGFIVEKSGTVARHDFPAWLQWDGRESVGIVVRKEALP